MKIIAIHGGQGAGKTTLSRSLTNRYIGMISLKFADIIYEMHEDILYTMREYGFETPKKHRGLLRFLGTEFAKPLFGEDVWCQILGERIITMHNEGLKQFVLDDMRFPNEYDLLKSLGAFMVYLDIPEDIRRHRAIDWRPGTHVSDVPLPGPWDVQTLHDLDFDNPGEYETKILEYIND